MFELATRTDTRTELSMLNTDTRTRYRYANCLRRVFCYRQQSRRRPTRAVQRQRSGACGYIPPPSRRGQPMKAGAGSAGLAAPSFTVMEMAPCRLRRWHRRPPARSFGSPPSRRRSFQAAPPAHPPHSCSRALLLHSAGTRMKQVYRTHSLTYTTSALMRNK